jgi:predicted metal-binding membrane protein
MLLARWPSWSEATPVRAGLVVLVAGALQFTAWKARHLACCRATPACPRCGAPDLLTAWRHGLRLGWHCTACCAGPTAALLAIGMMNRYAMAAVTVAITAERLAPGGARVAQAIGGAAIGTGLFVVARAATF